MSPKDYPDVMTLDEAAEYLRLKPRTIYGLAQTRKIPGAKLGNRWRFSKTALDEWLTGRQQAANGKEKNGGK